MVGNPPRDYELGSLKSRVDSHERWIEDVKTDTNTALERLEKKVDTLTDIVNQGRGITGFIKHMITLAVGLFGGHAMLK